MESDEESAILDDFSGDLMRVAGFLIGFSGISLAMPDSHEFCSLIARSAGFHQFRRIPMRKRGLTESFPGNFQFPVSAAVKEWAIVADQRGPSRRESVAMKMSPAPQS
jgi:hypothetical protein